MNVTVYTTPGCVQCTATVRALRNLGIEPQLVDVAGDPATRETLTKQGFRQLPVVAPAGRQPWSGYRPDHIRALTHKPPETAA